MGLPMPSIFIYLIVFLEVIPGPLQYLVAGKSLFFHFIYVFSQREVLPLRASGLVPLQRVL